MQPTSGVGRPCPPRLCSAHLLPACRASRFDGAARRVRSSTRPSPAQILHSPACNFSPSARGCAAFAALQPVLRSAYVHRWFGLLSALCRKLDAGAAFWVHSENSTRTELKMNTGLGDPFFLELRKGSSAAIRAAVRA